jgi:hypothetical protein
VNDEPQRDLCGKLYAWQGKMKSVLLLKQEQRHENGKGA